MPTKLKIRKEREDFRFLKPSSQGFTLIEFITAIIVIAIIIGIVVSTINTYQPNLALSGAVRELSTKLRYAQQLAVAQQIKHGVRFYSGQNIYEIVEYSQPEQIVETVTLAHGIAFQQVTFPNNEVKFNVYGAAIEAGEIVLSNENSATSTIEVRPSGFVKIIK